MKGKDILKLSMGEEALAGPTIADYLKATLVALIEEGEGFSGKRPLGNSDWDWQIAEVLIKEGVIDGTLDEYGYIESVGQSDIVKAVKKAIKAMA